MQFQCLVDLKSKAVMKQKQSFVLWSLLWMACWNLFWRICSGSEQIISCLRYNYEGEALQKRMSSQPVLNRFLCLTHSSSSICSCSGCARKDSCVVICWRDKLAFEFVSFFEVCARHIFISTNLPLDGFFEGPSSSSNESACVGWGSQSIGKHTHTDKTTWENVSARTLMANFASCRVIEVASKGR